MPLSSPGAVRRPERAKSNPSAIARIGLLLAVILSVVGLTSVAGTKPTAAADTVIELNPVAMTYTNSAQPTKVYNSYSETRLSQTQYATYLRFDTSKIAATSTIVSADLQLRVTTSRAT